MSDFGFRRWLKQFSKSRTPIDRSKPRGRRRPEIETLEDRNLLAVLPTAFVTAPSTIGASNSIVNENNPSVAQDPTNPSNIVEVHSAVYQDTFGDTAALVGNYSTDGGQTWSRFLIGTALTDPALDTGKITPTPTYTVITDPSVAWDRFGNIYLVAIERDATNNSGALIFQKFTFDGTAPVAVPSENKILERWYGTDPIFSPVVAVDNNEPLFVDPTLATNNTQGDGMANKAVYVAWSTQQTAPVDLVNEILDFNPNIIHVIASSDQGVNFTSPEIVNDDEHVALVSPDIPGARYAGPQIAFTQGSADGRVMGGQLVFVWNNFRTGAIRVDSSLADGVYSASVVAGSGGTGYAVGNLLTVVGGVFTTPAQLRVTSASAGKVTGVQVVTRGKYSIEPTGPVSVTGPGNDDAKFNLTFKVADSREFTGQTGLIDDAIAGAPASDPFVKTVKVAVAGSGYVAGENLIVDGANTTPAILTVDAVSGTGAITAISLLDPGSYPTALTNPVTASGSVAGQDAKFILTFDTIPAGASTLQETIFPVQVNITDPDFVVGDLDVTLYVTHPHLDQIKVFLEAPAPAGSPPGTLGKTVTLVQNRVDEAGNPVVLAPATRGLPDSANLGVTNVDGTFSSLIGTVFDDDAPRPISDSSATAPYAARFQPELGTLGVLANGLRGGNPLLDGTWKLHIIDYYNSEPPPATPPVAPPPQRVDAWSLKFNSRDMSSDGFGFDSTVLGSDAAGSIGTVVGSVVGTTRVPYSQPGVAPYGAPGVSTTLSVAVDNTLGGLSPYSGQLYIGYTSGSGTETNVRVATVAVGPTFSYLTKTVTVNDDTNPAGRLNPGQAQFHPTIAVDQVTGTLGVMYYDSRWDAANARVIVSFSASIDGATTFSKSAFLNTPKTAIDAITGTTITIEPIPGNQPQTGFFNGTTYDAGFGSRQGLAMHGGSVVPVFASNQNEAGSEIDTAAVTIAGGPRILSSDMGLVSKEFTTDFVNEPNVAYNNTFTSDGTRQLNGFVITFDRPVLVSSFDATSVTLVYRDTVTSTGAPGVTISPNDYEIVALDGKSVPFGLLSTSTLGLLATNFLVKMKPGKELSGVGTYSYAIGNLVGDPKIQDGIKSTAAPDTGNFIDQNQDGVTGQTPGSIFKADTVAIVPDFPISPSFPIPYTGTNYSVNDILTVQGGTFSHPAQLRVTDIFEGLNTTTGPILKVEIFDAGSYTVFPTGELTATGGTGSLAKFTMTSIFGFAAGDIYAVPRPTINGPFVLPYSSDTLPLIIPGPQAVNTSVAFNPNANLQAIDNLVLNGTNSAINVTFDRDIDPTSFTPDNILRFTGPAGTITSYSQGPLVTFTGGGGSGATGIATVSGGSIIAVTMLTQGSGYTTAPTVAFPGSNGVNAAGTAVISGGKVAGVTLTNVGRGYTTSAAQTIADGATLDTKITITDSLTVSDLTVGLKITHAQVKDLTVTLIAPDGTQVPLFANLTGANLNGTVIDQNGPKALTEGTGPYSGIFRDPLVVNSATAVLGGTKYAVNDVLTVQGGKGTAAQLKVTSVGAGGVITGVSVLQGGSYIDPSPNNVTVSTSGSGTGASFKLGYINTLSSLNGKNYQGVWTLRIVDAANGIGGTLDRFTLNPFTVDSSLRTPSTASVVAAGSGYKVGDVLDVLGGNASVPTEVLVTHVDASGGITGVVLVPYSSYYALPVNPVSVSGGTGSGATFNLATFVGTRTFQVGFPTQSRSGTYSISFGPDSNNKYIKDTALNSATVSVGGAGYAVGDLIDVSGTGGTTAQFQVKTLGAGGAVASVALVRPGTPTGSLTFTSATGVGTGAKLTLVFGNRVDTDTDAGVDLLRGGDPNNGSILPLTFNSSGANNNKLIPAISTVSSVINVGSSFLVQGVTLTLSINHQNIPDLTAELVAPDGFSVQLFSGVGTSGSTPHANFTNTTFDDSAFFPIQLASTSAGTGIGAGPFNPQFELGRFKDHGSLGDWSLRIKSNSSSLTGTIVKWSLTLKQSVAGSGLGEPVADQFTATFRNFTQDPTDARSETSWTAVGPAAIKDGTGLTQPNVYGSAGVNSDLTLAANTTVDSFIYVPSSFVVRGASVTLTIQHQNIPDLTATLISPDGVEVPLFSGAGTTGTVPHANFTNVVLDDSSTFSIQTTPTVAGLGIYDGPYSPLSPLGAVKEHNSQGNWILRIKNAATTLDGTLVKWSITLQQPVPNAGRIGGLAVDPSDPSGNTVYVAGASGGVWKTTNFLTADTRGPTYVPLTDLAPGYGLNVGSIAVFGRNNDTNQSIIFVATGEGDTATPGVGILRSMDGGKTWRLLDSLTNADASGNILPIGDAARDHTFVNKTAFKILVDPTPQASGEVIVYAAFSGTIAGTPGGVYRSNDSGRTWKLLRAGQATDIVLAPSIGSANAQILYAGFQGEGVYYTSNAPLAASMSIRGGGTGVPTRRDVTNSPADIEIPVSNPLVNPNGATTGRITLAAPAKTGRVLLDQLYAGWLYAFVSTATGGFKGLYLTKDFGLNWTLVRLPAKQTPLPNGIGTELSSTTDATAADYSVVNNGGNYAVSMAVDPNNPNIVYIGGNESQYNSTLNGTAGGGGFIRVDVTKIADPFALVTYNNRANDGGLVQTATTGAAITSGSNAGIITSYPPAPYVNMLRDPDNPFLTPSSLRFTGVSRFTNTGEGATFGPFGAADLYYTSNHHEIAVIRDPLTGATRVIMGNDEGVFTATDVGDGTSAPDIGNSVSVSGGRNGNLQIVQFYDGAAQPGVLSADLAGALLYGVSLNNSYPYSDPDVLDTGAIGWASPLGLGSGSGVKADQTGTGQSYFFKWPKFGASPLASDFFSVGFPGAGEISRTTGLLQAGDDPANGAGQWPSEGGSRFAVNPIDPTAIVVSSSDPTKGGRVFLTSGPQGTGIQWFPIAEPSDLDGTYAPALAFGAPETANSPLSGFIYAGTIGGKIVAGKVQSGKIFVTFTGGAPWKDISAGLDADGSAVQYIVANPTRGSHEAFAVTTTNVYWMPDSSVASPTWVKITGNLFDAALTRKIFNDPNQAIATLKTLTSLQADWRYQIPDDLNNPTGPKHPVLYAGGEGGVYRSLDKGTTWTYFPDTAIDGAFQEGGLLPSVRVTDLALSLGNINPADGAPFQQPFGRDMLVATTYGRGTFVIRLNDFITLPNGQPLYKYATTPVAGPHIVSVAGSNTSGPLTGIDVTFSGPVDPVTFTKDDIVSIVDSAGNSVPIGSVVDITGGQPHNVYNIVFTTPWSVYGNFQITIGSFISDFAGNRLDQNQNALTGGANGETPGDTFTGVVTYIRNTAPSFVKGADQVKSEDSGPQSVPGWATSVSVGPPADVATGQTLAFTVTNNNNGLFAVQPAVAPNGTLTYTFAPNVFGTAVVTIFAMDNGGTANGGADTSATFTFNITATSVNDRPTFNAGANISKTEDAGPQSIPNWASVSVGPANETGQTLTAIVQSATYTSPYYNTIAKFFSTPPTIDASGTLTYQTAPNANGTVTLTVVLKDNGGTANGGVDTSVARTFNIEATPSNDQPSFTVGPNQRVAGGAQSVPNFATNLLNYPAAPVAPSPDEVVQALTFTLSNDNPGLFAVQPSISPNGTLTYTPVANANGVATVMVFAKDNGSATNGINTSITQTFTITIKPKSGTSVGLASSLNPNVYSQASTITATVRDLTQPGVPPVSGSTGTVTFVVNGVARAPVAVSAGGTAVLPGILDAGVHTITATFSGDLGYAASAAPALTQTVTKASTTTVVTSAMSPSIVTQGILLTATVSPVAPATALPTGTVTFIIDGNPQTPSPVVNGVATFVRNFMAISPNHTVSAVFNATASPARFNNSASATIIQVVNPNPIAFSSVPANVVSSVRFPVVVRYLQSNGTTTDTTFNGPITLSLNSASTGGTFAPVTVNAVAGVATFNNLAIAKAGAYTFKAVSGTIPAVVSPNLNVTASSITAFFSAPPAAGAAVNMIINALDMTGGVARNYNAPAQVRVNSAPAGATVTGPLASTITNGVLTLVGLKFSKAGTYSLTVTSNSFTYSLSVVVTALGRFT
jgi:subtilisin-like proprotein convertase family protein